VSGGDSAKAGLFYSTLLIKHGIQDEHQRLMTSILEKTFKDVCRTLSGKQYPKRLGFNTNCKFCILDVIPQAEKTSETTFNCTPPDMYLKTKTAIEPISHGRVIVTCCKGQVINFLGYGNTFQITNKASSATNINLKEKWKVNFFKCIDASPLLVQFERYVENYCHLQQL
jgi:hypothetical protein